MSNLEFKFGSEDNPKGHAIIYFEEFDEIFASYVINFPIKGELSKYIPEMFKDQIPDEEMTKMVFPPVPEKFNDVEMNLVLEKLVIPYAIDICPDLTIIQGGADCLKDDPQSKISLSNVCYWQTISKLKDCLL